MRVDSRIWSPHRTLSETPPRRRPSRRGSTRCPASILPRIAPRSRRRMRMRASAAASARGRDGEPLIDRAIGTAVIVTGLKLDAGTVRAALLIGLAGANAFDAEDVAARFGAGCRGARGRALPAWTRFARRRRRRRRRARGAGGAAAQDAARDGGRHPRRADQARRTHGRRCAT